MYKHIETDMQRERAYVSFRKFTPFPGLNFGFRPKFEIPEPVIVAGWCRC